MAAYDTERRCLIARVVFDGAALAGKTTNLQVVRDLFPSERRSELYTPGALKGRTMFFDWLEVEGKQSGRVSVKFQLISVPGQKQRNYRRRPLVEMADVVVFVVDSDPFAIPESVRTYNRLKTSIRKRGRPVPLLVQANKQDIPGALTPEQIRRRLKLGEGVPIVPATTCNGSGVRKTITLALQMARQEMVAQKKAGLVRRQSAHMADADALFMRMLEIETGGRSRRTRRSEAPAVGAAGTEGEAASEAADTAGAEGVIASAYAESEAGAGGPEGGASDAGGPEEGASDAGGPEGGASDAGGPEGGASDAGGPESPRAAQDEEPLPDASTHSSAATADETTPPPPVEVTPEPTELAAAAYDD